MASLVTDETIETPPTEQPLTLKINNIINDWIVDNAPQEGEGGRYGYEYRNHFGILSEKSGFLFEINDENPVFNVFERYGKIDIDFLEELDAFLEYMYSVDKEIINYEGYWKLKIIIESCFPFDYEIEGGEEAMEEEEKPKEEYPLTKADKKLIRGAIDPNEFKEKFEEEEVNKIKEYANERMKIAKEIDDWYSLCDGDVAVIGVNDTSGDATIEFLTELKPELGDVETPSTPGQLKRTSSNDTPGTLQRRQTVAQQIKKFRENDAQFMQLIKNTAEDELNSSVNDYCSLGNLGREECERIKASYGKAFKENKDKIKVEAFIEEDQEFINIQKTLFETGKTVYEELSGIHRKKTMKSVKKKFKKHYDSGSESDGSVSVKSPPPLRRQSSVGLKDIDEMDDDDIPLTEADENFFHSLEIEENVLRDYNSIADSLLLQALDEVEERLKSDKKSDKSGGGIRKNKKKKRRRRRTKKKRRRKKKTRYRR